MGSAKKGRTANEWKRGVEIGGAFELVDSINKYARRRSSLLADLSG